MLLRHYKPDLYNADSSHCNERYDQTDNNTTTSSSFAMEPPIYCGQSKCVHKYTNITQIWQSSFAPPPVYCGQSKCVRPTVHWKVRSQSSAQTNRIIRIEPTMIGPLSFAIQSLSSTNKTCWGLPKASRGLLRWLSQWGFKLAVDKWVTSKYDNVTPQNFVADQYKTYLRWLSQQGCTSEGVEGRIGS